jgi:hypothetical protein
MVEGEIPTFEESAWITDVTDIYRGCVYSHPRIVKLVKSADGEGAAITERLGYEKEPIGSTRPRLGC